MADTDAGEEPTYEEMIELCKQTIAGVGWDRLSPEVFLRDYVEPLHEAVLRDVDVKIAEAVLDDDTEVELAETKAKLEVSTAVSNHGRQLALGWSAYAFSFGQLGGYIDEKGQPTDKCPPELVKLHMELSLSHGQFLEKFVEVYGVKP